MGLSLTFVPVGLLLDTKQFLPLRKPCMIRSAVLRTEELKAECDGTDL